MRPGLDCTSRSSRARAGLVLALFAGISSTARLTGADAAAAAGEQIYRERCASCHGAAGEGVKGKHEPPLVGDKSVLQLARYIEKNMPEDKPGTCTGEAALAVARHVHESFYSPLAQARNRPARIELSRLTVRQYQNAVADLIGSFRKATAANYERGLRGEYYDARQPGGRRVLERLDAGVKFHFERGTPSPEGLATKGFAARWTGSVLAPDTGEYEIVVRTNHAARLWLNDLDRPLIDVWVQSGSDTDHGASVTLLGGRAYAVKLELSSRKQGVDDKDKKKVDDKPVEALIELCWKPPKRVLEPIPARHLSPVTAAEVYIARAAFPPDDRSVGYERGTSITAAWDEAATEAAIDAAGYVATRLEELSGARKGDADREAKVRAFCGNLVERAFRRPPGEEERRVYIERQLVAAPDLETAVKRVVILTLKSPRFLYIGLGAAHPDAYMVATRLSFALWDSIPDAALLDAAAQGRLLSRPEVTAQADRMLRDPRTRSKLRHFFLQWLQVEHVPDLAKDAGRFPGFGAELASDLRASLDLFLDDVVWGEGSDFRRLFLADELYLNGSLARCYGIELPADAPFQRVDVDPAQRAGVLSHPYLMARFAYTDSSSPIHRGVFLVRSVLGRALRPPPEAAAPLPVALHPMLTTRERVSLQTEPKPCQGCHEMINPLGFALEHFDAVGRYREEERGKPVDASGFYEPSSGERRSFKGVRELAEILVSSDEVHAAFVAQLFHHTVKQPILAHGLDLPGKLRRAFAASGFSIRRLLAEIATTAALTGLPEAGDPQGLREL